MWRLILDISGPCFRPKGCNVFYDDHFSQVVRSHLSLCSHCLSLTDRGWTIQLMTSDWHLDVWLILLTLFTLFMDVWKLIFTSFLTGSTTNISGSTLKKTQCLLSQIWKVSFLLSNCDVIFANFFYLNQE